MEKSISNENKGKYVLSTNFNDTIFTLSKEDLIKIAESEINSIMKENFDGTEKDYQEQMQLWSATKSKITNNGDSKYILKVLEDLGYVVIKEPPNKTNSERGR